MVHTVTCTRVKGVTAREGIVRVLVVEDEIDLADAVARGLRRHGMSVDVCYDGDDGFGQATTLSYDVLLLDRDLPGTSGDQICRAVTAGTPARVIMLTASASRDARATGLSLGASDYVTKPFVFADLVQRVRALGPGTEHEPRDRDPFEID
jgi:DNA-binding response OmpR family regulator